MNGQAPRRQRLPHATVSRSLAALAIAVAGVMLCLACDHWFQVHMYPWRLRYADPATAPFFAHPWGDVFVSWPILGAGLALLVSPLRVRAAFVAAVGIAAMTVWAYRADASTDSSTAPLALFVPWFVGPGFAVIVWVADEALTRRRASRDSPSD